MSALWEMGKSKTQLEVPAGTSGGGTGVVDASNSEVLLGRENRTSARSSRPKRRQKWRPRRTCDRRSGRRPAFEARYMQTLDLRPEHFRRSAGCAHQIDENRSQIHADGEWDRIARERRGSAALSRWAATSPNLAAHRNLNQVLTAMRHLGREASNEYWAELLILGRAGDQLARRVMLQAVVPALEAETTRWHRVFTNHLVSPTRDEVEQLVYAAAIQALSQLESRERVTWPVLDVLRGVRRLVGASVRSDERWAQSTVSIDQAESVDIAAAPVDTSPSDGLREVLLELVDAGRVSAENASLVWHTRSGSRTFEDLAEEYGTSPDTLRRRRHRAERALHGALAHAA